ncbi:MAG: APC family permease [Steroidobacterales bacterium]
MNPAPRPQLLGFWMCVALVVGNSIGSGVFMLPASLAPYGRNSLVAWLFTATGAILLALLFSQLSRAHPHAGGPYAYTRLAFGPFPAFVVAWGYWISIWVGNAAIVTGAVSYLTPLFPQLATSSVRSASVTMVALWGLTFVNWWGIRASGWVQSVTTVLKLLPLFAIAAVGLMSFGEASRSPVAQLPLSLSGTTAAATLTLWALLGLESATIPADKVHDPSRTIPRATLIGAVLTAAICMLACSTVLLLVPSTTLAHSDAPFVDLARQLWGGSAGKLVALLVAISAFGCLNGWILLQGELPSAMAKTGVFPALFARESSRRTPGFGLIFGSALVTALILMNYQKSLANIFTFMILLSTTACLVMYAVCSLALLRLIWTKQMLGATMRAAPLALIGVIATLYSLWAIVGAGPEAVIWGCVLLACGTPVYLLVRNKSG